MQIQDKAIFFGPHTDMCAFPGSTRILTLVDAGEQGYIFSFVTLLQPCLRPVCKYVQSILRTGDFIKPV